MPGHGDITINFLGSGCGRRAAANAVLSIDFNSAHQPSLKVSLIFRIASAHFQSLNRRGARPCPILRRLCNLISQLPSFFATLSHLIQHFFGHLHGVHSGRDSTVDGAVKNGLPDLQFRKAVIPCPADMRG